MNGSYYVKLDDKNRLIVPTKLRASLGETFYVTLGVNCGYRCLTVYTEEDWQKLTEKYNQLPIAQRGAATSLLFMFAADCTPDKQFRFMLPQDLLDYANLTRDVVIAGRACQIEIWNDADFKKFVAENNNPDKLLESLQNVQI